MVKHHEPLQFFLEKAICQILYVRKVYPQDIFQAENYYGVPVHYPNSENLQTYITNAVTSVLSLPRDNVNCIVLTLTDELDRPVESFGFNLSPNSHPEIGTSEAEINCLAQLLLLDVSSPPAKVSSFVLQVVGDFTVGTDLWRPSTKTSHIRKPAPSSLKSVYLGNHVCTVIQDCEIVH
ncbi:hypothetical protein P9112_005463 [Eukaryota sp. TZLM1-RC]